MTNRKTSDSGLSSIKSLATTTILTVALSTGLLLSGCNGSSANLTDDNGGDPEQITEAEYCQNMAQSVSQTPNLEDGETIVEVTADSIGGCKVETTRYLRIYTPKYNRLTLHVGPSNPEQLPGRSLIFPAAYTKGGSEPMIEQIVGDFVIADSLYKGVDDPYITGYFLFNPDNGEFDFIPASEKQRLAEAAEHHGVAFGQDMVLYDGFIIKTVREQEGTDRVDRYRVLCSLGGELRVVESHGKVKFQKFQKLLQELGVKDAIYLDMGSYNYGWYQDEEGFKDLPDVYSFKDDKYSNFLMFEM